MVALVIQVLYTSAIRAVTGQKKRKAHYAKRKVYFS